MAGRTGVAHYVIRRLCRIFGRGPTHLLVLEHRATLLCKYNIQLCRNPTYNCAEIQVTCTMYIITTYNCMEIQHTTVRKYNCAEIQHTTKQKYKWLNCTMYIITCTILQHTTAWKYNIQLCGNTTYNCAQLRFKGVRSENS